MFISFRRLFSLRVVQLSFIGFIFASTANAQWVDDEDSKIAPDLERVMNNTTNPIPVIVVLSPVTPLPQTFVGSLTASQTEKLIKQRALESQLEFRHYVNELVQIMPLDGEAKPLSRYKFFWTVNGFMATATPDVIADISMRDGVQQIFLDKKIKLAPDYREEVEIDGGEYTYGLEKIGVPQIRSEHPELTGKGVRVGIIDTGIDGKHPEVAGRVTHFKDFVGSKTEPYDDNGHGTHVAGTIGGSGAGGTQIGVAPEVTFIVAKAFTGGGSGSLSGLLRAMEWAANPSENSSSSERPHVISNSWGGAPSSDVSKDPFAQPVLTWVQLGIFPSFAAGNSGPSAGTVGSPGCLPASFAVGATDDNDSAASFSSRGPVKIIVDGKPQTLVKPDISAPGVKIFSAMPGGKYGAMSGTSMATPHLSGAVALMYQIKPNASVQEMRDLLSQSVDMVGGRSGKDNTFGAGRLNIAKAVSRMQMNGYSFDEFGF